MCDEKHKPSKQRLSEKKINGKMYVEFVNLFAYARFEPESPTHL